MNYSSNYFNNLAELGPDPFSRGKPCSLDTDCNQALGVSCCGGEDHEASARCCPDGLCMECQDANDNSVTFHYCGTYCPDHAKTTQTTPAYLSTTTSHGPITTTTTPTPTTTSANDTMFELDDEFGFLLLNYEDEDED